MCCAPASERAVGSPPQALGGGRLVRCAGLAPCPPRAAPSLAGPPVCAEACSPRAGPARALLRQAGCRALHHRPCPCCRRGPPGCFGAPSPAASAILGVCSTGRPRGERAERGGLHPGPPIQRPPRPLLPDAARLAQEPGSLPTPVFSCGSGLPVTWGPSPSPGDWAGAVGRPGQLPRNLLLSAICWGRKITRGEAGCVESRLQGPQGCCSRASAAVGPWGPQASWLLAESMAGLSPGVGHVPWVKHGARGGAPAGRLCAGRLWLPRGGRQESGAGGQTVGQPRCPSLGPRPLGGCGLGRGPDGRLCPWAWRVGAGLQVGVQDGPGGRCAAWSPPGNQPVWTASRLGLPLVSRHLGIDWELIPLRADGPPFGTAQEVQ